MNQRRSELLLANNQSKWKETACASLLCSLKVSSLLPSVDLESFNDAHFGYSPKSASSRSNKSQQGVVKSISSKLVEYFALDELQENVHNSNAVRREASPFQISLGSATVSLHNIYGSSGKQRRTLQEMIRTGRLDYEADTQPSVDMPMASTSGTVDGGFWKERRRGRNPVIYQPIGNFYSSYGEERFRNCWELPQGKTLEDNVKIDQNHSVSSGFEHGKNEKSIWLSTSHKLGANHVVATQYATDLQEGNSFTVNSTHNSIRDSTLSTNWHANSLGECSVEVELQKKKKRRNHKVLESIMVNLRTGDTHLKLQSRNVLKGMTLMNSIVSNMRGQHALRFIATIPLWRSAIVSSSLATDMNGRQSLFMHAVQKIHEQMMIGATCSTNLEQEHFMSMEAQYQLNGLGNLVLKLTNDFQCLRQLEVTTSITTKRNSWLWQYRNVPANGRSLLVEWKRELSPEHFFIIRAAAKDWICTPYAEICLPC